METKVHDLRKQIDAVIQMTQDLQNESRTTTTSGQREFALTHTKLQEAKMWAGKILEAYGSPYPEELADKA